MAETKLIQCRHCGESFIEAGARLPRGLTPTNHETPAGNGGGFVTKGGPRGRKRITGKDLWKRF
jgi:hypothetical protein